MQNGRLQLILTTRYKDLESEAERSAYIENLEVMIDECRKSAAQGIEKVPDSIYDNMIDLLREIKPDSELLKVVWSEDENAIDEDLDKYLLSMPMLSIMTIKSMNDKALQTFRSLLPAGRTEIISSMKENGHGIRIVFKDGYLTKAYSRGRRTNGKDLTKQLKLICGDFFAELESYPIVEVRGEVLLPFSNLDAAREFNPSIKSAFSGVSSMIRESASPEETKLLHFVAYDVFGDGLNDFERLSDKFAFLEEVGFEVPYYKLSDIGRDTFEEDIENIIMDMDMETTSYEYFTDGIVTAVDDLALFKEFGTEDSYRLGNVALKMGRLQQDKYAGTVGRIEWIAGKSKKTPVAVLEEPVLTAQGNHVSNIPLYAPCYILMLEAYPGNIINFKYGGEAGVIPVLPDGRLVTEVKQDISL